MEKTAEILFQYLKNILYHPDKAELDLTQIPAEFQKFGQGMQFLANCVREERIFMKALAKGDLSMQPPAADNVIAAPAKELQASLRHLEWQTEQVAKGDYSQRVDFMGEFSAAFNTMTEQLSERTKGLIAERRLVEKRNRELQQNLDLLLALTNYTHNMIFVFSAKDGEQIFRNNPADWFAQAKPDVFQILSERLREKQKGIKGGSMNWETSLDKEAGGRTYYGIESFFIRWHREPAIVHIVIDDTERRKRENLIFTLAYRDPLTGLNNRRYAMDLMENWIQEKTPFVLSFIDVDYLKYCNDTYGHESGDRYLTDVANLLGTMDCELCRVGGDEFFMLAAGTGSEERDCQLSNLRGLLIAQKDKPYPQSFSFATCEVAAEPEMTLQEYISNTDTKMYEYKLKHKIPLSDVLYQDDRM